MNKNHRPVPARFGFRQQWGGAHSARTMMLKELRTLLSFVPDPGADRETYIRAITIDNCLGKRSARTRQITARHLAELYALEPDNVLFRALRFLWKRDEAAQPLLALLCSFARDTILRVSAPCVLGLRPGEPASRENLEQFIEAKEPGRFSAATLKSIAQNVSSTLTQSGHLKNKVKKIRSVATATAGSTAYALLLGYLRGIRGEELFSSEYTKLLDCSQDIAIEMAREASRRGWIVFKQIGRVMEVTFPSLLTQRELEWIREQN